MLPHRTCAAKLWSFTLPAASDNAPTEAGLDKLWSTAEPLGSFLKLAAAWAAKHHVDFQVTHLAGEKNKWADALSRNKVSVFQHRTAERCRFPLEAFLDTQGCVVLHPPEATWADELRAARTLSGEKKGYASLRMLASSFFFCVTPRLLFLLLAVASAEVSHSPTRMGERHGTYGLLET